MWLHCSCQLGTITTESGSRYLGLPFEIAKAFLCISEVALPSSEASKQAGFSMCRREEALTRQDFQRAVDAWLSGQLTLVYQHQPPAPRQQEERANIEHAHMLQESSSSTLVIHGLGPRRSPVIQMRHLVWALEKPIGLLLLKGCLKGYLCAQKSKSLLWLSSRILFGCKEKLANKSSLLFS